MTFYECFVHFILYTFHLIFSALSRCLILKLLLYSFPLDTGSYKKEHTVHKDWAHFNIKRYSLLEIGLGSFTYYIKARKGFRIIYTSVILLNPIPKFVFEGAGGLIWLKIGIYVIYENALIYLI